MSQPLVALMPDGKRLHCQYGPIDLVIQARGERAAVSDAYELAEQTFRPILQQLVDELPILRAPLSPDGGDPNSPVDPVGPVAIRMVRAARLVGSGQFVTPMAAVAGAVADHMLAALTRIEGLDQVYVNNGGDIALWLARGQTFRVALCDDPIRASIAGHFSIAANDKIGGIATSGWQGRSLSLGIADAVTVTATCAADADVAATLIANDVDLPGHPGIERAKAADVNPDSDLKDQLVTVGVGVLSAADVDLAISRGKALAESLIDQQIISNAAVSLCGQVRVCGVRPSMLEQADVLC